MHTVSTSWVFAVPDAGSEPPGADAALQAIVAEVAAAGVRVRPSGSDLASRALAAVRATLSERALFRSEGDELAEHLARVGRIAA
jgi:hypothetical protein